MKNEKPKMQILRKKTDKVMKIDIDIRWIPICDDVGCMIQLYIDCWMDDIIKF